MIKLVGIDLDGTLLNASKDVSEEDASAIEELERNGIIVTVFTGRTWNAAKEYLRFFSNDVPAVFQNGAYILTTRTQKVLRKVTLPDFKALELLRKAKERSFFTLLTVSFSSIPDMVYEGPLPYRSNFFEYLRRNSYRMKDVKNVEKYVGPETNGVVWIGNVRKIMDASRELELSEVTMVVDTVTEEEAFVEFFGKGCGKEKAMELLLERYGISEEEAVFIGDSYNDLNVLKKVRSVAMANAPQEIRRCADFVTLSNNDSGVSYAVKKFILKENDLVD